MGSQRFTGQVPLQEHETFSKNTSCMNIFHKPALCVLWESFVFLQGDLICKPFRSHHNLWRGSLRCHRASRCLVRIFRAQRRWIYEFPECPLDWLECLFTCIYMYMHIYIYMHTHLCIYIYMCIYKCVCICIYKYVYICIYIHAYTCIYVHTCIYVQIYIYVHTQMYTHICLYIYICSIYICIYMYIYIFKLKILRQPLAAARPKLWYMKTITNGHVLM